ncbi:MAG: DUF4466 family protein [Prevotellaceae bacterium]|jgi:hypothetical protein|nr:DUF4466 family protein [Prevotellaceae bacterium]
MKSLSKKLPPLLLAFLLPLTSLTPSGCTEKDTEVALLKNDCLKRSVGPNVVGLDIEFAYAMATPYGAGRIVSACVEADIAGAPQTWLEHRYYHTDRETGADVGMTVGNPSVNDGNRTTVEFTVDTCAATLRYYYRIPEEARGKSVTFTFSATSSAGETVSMKMGPYAISKMDIKKNISARSAARFLSIEDMAVYSAADAAKIPEKIDLVYLRPDGSSPYYDLIGPAFVSPAADPQYRPGVTLPAGANNDTKIRKEYGVHDRHLATLDGPNAVSSGVFIDDVDFETIKLDDMPDYALGLRQYSCLWVETHDGRYRAFIYVSALNGEGVSSCTIHIKRLKIK